MIFDRFVTPRWVIQFTLASLTTAATVTHAAAKPSFTTPAAGVTTLRVDVAEGSVAIIPAGDGEITVSIEPQDGAMRCKSSTTRDGDLVSVSVMQVGIIPLWQECKANVTIAVGPGINVALKMDAGSIDLNGSFHHIDAKLEAGVMALNGIAKEANLNVAAGSMRVLYTDVPTGALHLDSGAGIIAVTLPAATKVRQELDTTIALHRNDFVSTADAAFLLHVKAGFGLVSINRQ